jgi:hypothetical protein
MNQKLLKKYFLVLIAGIFLFSCAGMNSTKDTRSIDTSTGIIQGIIKNQVISWEDIPYAQPPVGDLRWRAPRAFEGQGRTIVANEFRSRLHFRAWPLSHHTRCASLPLSLIYHGEIVLMTILHRSL